MLGYKTPPKTALDALTFSEPDKTKHHKFPNCNEGDYASSGEDVEDLVFRTAIQQVELVISTWTFQRPQEYPKVSGKRQKKSCICTCWHF